MADFGKRNTRGALLLSECYTLAARYAANDAARDILQARARDTGVADGCVPEKTSLPHSVQQAVSRIQLALSLGTAVPTSGTGTPLRNALQIALSGQASHAGSNNSEILREISALPDCGDKEYLLALLALRNGRGNAQRLEAVRHIQVARNFSPNDPRYIALAEILLEENR